MKIPEQTVYTIIQLVIGAAMGIAGFALIFGVTVFTQIPETIWIIICMLCIAGIFLKDALIQMMSAMSTNVEPEPFEYPEESEGLK